MLRPLRQPGNAKAIDESTDTYDTIDWMLKNLPEQQRARGHVRHVLSWLARGHGRARTASGSESRHRRSDSRRHVSG